MLGLTFSVLLTISIVAFELPQPANSIYASDSILHRNVVLPLSDINLLFPEITHEISSGQNITAVGNPEKTISLIYANQDSSKKVTITIDQYKNVEDASYAFQQAILKSKLPGFKLLSIPSLGQESFGGTVTMNEETHIGIGLLNKDLIIGLTLAGFEASPNNIDNLVKLARKESNLAKNILNISQ